MTDAQTSLKVARIQPRTLGLQAVCVVAFWSVIVAYVLHAVIPSNPIRLPKEDLIAAKVWAPQGWAFFTRNPKGPVLKAFALKQGSWRLIQLPRNGSGENLLGFSRRARALGIELGLVTSFVHESEWFDCETDPADCLAQISRSKKVKNRVSEPRLCGEIGIVFQEPLPWAWAAKEITMPSKISRLSVRC